MFTATDWIRDKNRLMVLTPFPIKWAGKAAKQVYHKLRQKDTGNDAECQGLSLWERCLRSRRRGQARWRLTVRLPFVQPLSLTSFDKAGLRLPASASLPLASRWPLPQQLLPVSAAGGGRRRCPSRGASGETVHFAGPAKASPTRGGGSASALTERLYEDGPALCSKARPFAPCRASGVQHRPYRHARGSPFGGAVTEGD